MPRLLCMLDGNGLPLLSRPYGGLPPPSFPNVALLGTVAKFAEHNGQVLQRFASDDVRTVFSSFPGDIVLVLVTNEMTTPEAQLVALLHRVYDAGTLLLGLPAMRGNSEQLKRHLRAALPLIDRISSDEEAAPGLALGAVEMLNVPEEAGGEALDAALRGVAAEAGLEHMALAVGGRFCSATPDWWGLQVNEILLLQQLLAALPPATMRDIPVFPPTTSPEVPYRMLTCTLVAGVELVALGGPELSLEQLAKMSREHFEGATDILRKVLAWAPWGQPPSLALEPEVLSCMLVRRDVSQVLTVVRRPTLAAGVGVGRGVGGGAVEPPGPSALRGLVTFANLAGAYLVAPPADGSSTLELVPLPNESSATDILMSTADKRMVAMIDGPVELYAALSLSVPAHMAPVAARQLVDKLRTTFER